VSAPIVTGGAYRHDDIPHPHAFTREVVGWVPWLPPPARESLTPRQIDGLVEEQRAASDYFRLLALDPEVLRERTLTDKGIFYNEDAGLPRAERELAAAVASRLNGCVFCASVHARFAARLSDRAEDVDRLLAEGVDADGARADLGEHWNAIAAAAAALTVTPIAFGPEHVARLRDVGLDDLAILDVIQSAAFFNWANRLMLTLGRAVAPA